MSSSEVDFRGSTSASADFMPNYRLVNTLHGHQEGVFSLKFSPNGYCLASGSSDERILIWGASNGELKTTLMGHRRAVNALAWTSDSRFLVSASSDDTLKLWDLEAERYVTTMRGHRRSVGCCDFKPQSTVLASGSIDSDARLWDTRAKEFIGLITVHKNSVTGVQFNEDGSRLVSCSLDGQCRLWNADTGVCVTSLLNDKTTAVGGAMFCPYASGILVSKLGNRIELWDTTKCELLKQYTGHKNTRFCITGIYTAAGSKQCIVSGSEKGSVFIWDAHTTNVVQKLSGHSDVVRTTACHPTQDIIASGGDDMDTTIKIWKSKNESNK